jgi:hypothetical protein
MTILSWHVSSFCHFAEQPHRLTSKVTISFTQSYRKTREILALRHGNSVFKWRKNDCEKNINLVTALTSTSNEHGMQLTICSPAAFVVSGAGPATCIDTVRLSHLSGQAV